MNIKFIADIGSNHNQDLKRAFKLIEVAKNIGCWGVKFQLFKADKLFTNGFGDKEELKKRELPPIWISLLKGKCNQLNLKFGCTPFDLDAVDHLKYSVDFFKISSFDILRHDLIKKCAETQKPIMFSTGLAFYSDVTNCLDVIKKTGNNNVTILYCVSDYPAELENCNLYNIQTYTIFNKNVGYSDHTTKPGVIHKAIQNHAKTIEFHLDLADGKGYEFEYGHCWKPRKIYDVIHDVQVGEKANRVNSHVADCYQRADPSDGLRPMKNIRGE